MTSNFDAIDTGGRKRFDDLIDHAPDIVACFDRELRHVYVNDAVAGATGRPPADFIGKTNAELGMASDLVALWDGALRRVIDGNAEESIEFSYVATDGNVRWFLGRISPLRSSGGDVVQALAIVRDVTHLKRVEQERLTDVRVETAESFIEELRQASAKLALTVDAAELGTFEDDPATGRLIWSNRLLSIFEFPEDVQPTREEFLAHVHPDDVERVWRAAREADIESRPGVTYRVDYRIITRSGAVKLLRAHVRRYDIAGRWLAIGTVADITEMDRRERELRVIQERLATAQNAAAVGIWDWNIISDEAQWTERAWELFGHPAGSFEVTRERWLSSVHPDDRESASRAVERSMVSGSYREEFRVVHADGTIIWVESRGRCLMDDEGRPVRMIGTVMDVTERHEAQKRLADRERELAAIVKSRDEFIAVLSHDLRNALTTVLGGSQFLDYVLQDDLKDQAAAIRASAEHMKRIVDDLLDLSRIERGGYDLRLQAVDVAQIVRSICIGLDQRSMASGISVRCDDEEIPVWGMIDRTAFERVLANLVSNAIKFSAAGGEVVVTFRAAASECRISVRDFGPGVAPAIREHLFDRFTRSDDPRAGTGLGLVIAKSLVEAHGGQIWFQAHEPGSEFIFTLPRIEHPAPRA